MIKNKIAEKIGHSITGEEELCKECHSKVSRKIIGEDKTKDYGHIVIHRKHCPYLNKLLKNSVEV